MQRQRGEWGLCAMGERGQMVQTSSYEISESWDIISWDVNHQM